MKRLPAATVLKKSRTLALGILLCGIAGSVSAQGGPGEPPGAPPDGMAGGPPPNDANGRPLRADGAGGRPPGGGGARVAEKLSGVYTVNGTTETAVGQTITSITNDVSAVYVLNGGNLLLSNVTVTTSGDTSSQDNSSFLGQNAGVLVTRNSRVTIFGGSITTSGSGANGLFAYGSGAFAAMTGGSITATGDGGHGPMASGGGTLAITNVVITTSQIHGGAVATDRGGGTLWVSGGTITTHGQDSPGIYSTGDIRAENATFTATASEGAVIEGRNSIALNRCAMTGAVKCGVMIYQSFSGDAEGREGAFSMTGGSLAAAQGPLFFVNNTKGVIHLQGVKLFSASGVLVKAAASRWGRNGANGGAVVLTADHETLAGNLVADSISALTANFQNHTTLTGAVQNGALTLDASSAWNVTADSTLTSLGCADGEAGLARITGNGHRIRYQSALAANQWLGGKTWKLAGGGTLSPE